METEAIKISISPRKIKYFLLITGILLIFVWLAEKYNISSNVQKEQKEFVMPLDLGVADPGFEGKIVNFATLNARASIDPREKIDGVSSLKISFSDQPIASVKVSNYFNIVGEGDFYRIGFWAKNDSNEDKQITLRIADKEKIQDLGKFSLNNNDDVRYFEFNFQADNNAQDLSFTSDDGIATNIWIDNFSVEKINVSSLEELRNLAPTISGNTTWKNVDQNQGSDGGDSGDFLSRPARKIGQIFHPSQEMLSGVAFKILRYGTGGTGTFQVQLRGFDENLGGIDDRVIASVPMVYAPTLEILDMIKKKEQQMRENFVAKEKEIKDAFLDKEQDIKAGKIEDIGVANYYPDTFTQDQIDAANAARRTAQADAQIAKRTAELEMSIRDMKESFNTTEQLYIPLAARLDTDKKYWIGIDNGGVVVDQDNYISVATASAKSKTENIGNAKPGSGTDAENDNNGKQDGVGGFMSEVPGTWTNSSALWFETFYPEHYRVNNEKILSGATISDMGDGKAIYRYHFAPNDITSLSGFSGRKVYDMFEGSYSSIDISGNYKLSTRKS